MLSVKEESQGGWNCQLSVGVFDKDLFSMLVVFPILYVVSSLIWSRTMIMKVAVSLCTAAASFGVDGPVGRAVPNTNVSLVTCTLHIRLEVVVAVAAVSAEPAREGGGCPVPNTKAKDLPALSPVPVTSDGDGETDGRTCVVIVIFWAGDCPKPNTKSCPAQ